MAKCKWGIVLSCAVFGGLAVMGDVHADSPSPPSADPLVYLPLVLNTYPLRAEVHLVTLSGTTVPEVVTIQNVGNGPQDMTGWSLVSIIGPQTFYFPTGYILAAGASVQVQSYEGATDNPPAILFWTSAAMWNNAGDTAVLYDDANVAISSLCYGDACP